MTPQERIVHTVRGAAIDRIPVFTQIPFGTTSQGFKPAPFHGYEEYDHWRESDPEYQKLVKRMERECDNFFIWRPPCMLSDQFFIPPSMTRTLPPVQKQGKVETTTILETSKGELQSVSAVQPGTGHSWQLEHFCKSARDAQLLLELPWKGQDVTVGDFFGLREMLGPRGLMWVTIPSPILVVCRLFDPGTFMILVRTEQSLIKRLMDTAFERIEANLKKLLEAGAGPIVRFGGAEHATPPMLSPDDFDALVVAYDKPLMDLCKKYDCMVAVHCHGRIRHALQRFVEMGVDMTDPVETFPDGDLTLAEAREIAGDKITLCGNIQMRDLYAAKPEQIEERVKEIVAEMGPHHLILTTTGTPLEKMSPTLAANYHRFIDAGLKHGRIE